MAFYTKGGQLNHHWGYADRPWVQYKNFNIMCRVLLMYIALWVMWLLAVRRHFQSHTTAYNNHKKRHATH